MKPVTLLLAGAITLGAAAPALAGGFNAWLDRSNAKYEHLYWKPAWAYHPIRGYDDCKDGLLIRKQRCRENYFKYNKPYARTPSSYGAAK